MSTINVLFYDRNKEDCQEFKKHQDELHRKRQRDSSRNVYTASSLDDLESLNIAKNAPVVALFDAYQGNIFDPNVVEAARYVQDASGEMNSPFHQRRYLLLRTEDDLSDFLKESLKKDVFIRVLYKDSSVYNLPDLMEAVLDAGEFANDPSFVPRD